MTEKKTTFNNFRGTVSNFYSVVLTLYLMSKFQLVSSVQAREIPKRVFKTQSDSFYVCF